MTADPSASAALPVRRRPTAGRRRPAVTRAAPDTPRELRQQVLADARRTHILDSARAAFADLGLDGASLREIARRAGYTAGAIYSYFPSKEDVYATLLSESLDRLIDHIDGRVAGAATPTRGAEALRRAALGFFEFYHAHPRDLDLGFYLFGGMQPRGLTPRWDSRLNARLRRALRPQEKALAALGFAAGPAAAELTALFAHITGLLLLRHTGRIRMFRCNAHDLLDHYLEALIARAPAMNR